LRRHRQTSDQTGENEREWSAQIEPDNPRRRRDRGRGGPGLRKNVGSSGPIFDEIGIDGSNAVLHFTHTGGGLVAKGGAPAGFAVAGEDRKFFFADAKIDGDRVIVSSPQVAKPVAVRYGWADLPKVNLFGKDGLPASSFRTDDWPLP
jgi:sialate O-acetylesterase